MSYRYARPRSGHILAALVLFAGLVSVACSSSQGGTSQSVTLRDPNQAVYEFEGAVAGSNPWNVVALSKGSGQVLWRHNMGGRGRSWPLQAGSTVYASANASHGTVLQALDASSGQLRWQHASPGAIDTVPTINGDLVFLSSEPGIEDGKLEALRASDGSVVWQASVGAFPYPPTIIGDTVYLFAGTLVMAFNREDGTMLWTYATGSFVTTNDVTNVVVPVVNGGIVYVEPIARDASGAAMMPLIALDAATGSVKWSYQSTGITSEPVLDGTTVYITATNQDSPAHSVLSALDTQTGTARWTHVTEPGIIATNPVAQDGHVYVAVGGNDSTAASGVLALDAASGKQVWNHTLKRQIVGITPIEWVATSGLLGLIDDANTCLTMLNTSDGSQLWCKPVFTLDHMTIIDGVLYGSALSAAHPDGEYAAVRLSDGAVLWDTHAGA